MRDAAMTAGSEDRRGRAPDASAFAAALKQCDVVSFDIFDTLFIRLVADPEDVFDLVGQKHHLFGFREARKAAQAQAFQVMIREGRHEITLDGIYACLQDVGVPADLLMASEIEIELAVLRPNPECLALLDRARSGRKRIALISDMYLPEKMLADLCARHGVTYDALFVSADRQATKRDHGALYKLVADDLGLAPGRILHIGDNPLADIQRGQESGVATLLYRPDQAIHAPREAALYSAVVAGVARSQAYRPDLSMLERYGFAYGAAAAYGFLNWLADKAAEDGVDHMLFLARDGFVLQELWSDLPLPGAPKAERAPSTYFKGTRTSLTLAAMDKFTFDSDVEFLLSGAHGLQLGDLFDRIGVEAPSEQVLRDLGLSIATAVGDENHPLFVRLFQALRWSILKVCFECRRGLHVYLRQVGLRDGMKVAVVDVGWSGTTQIALERALARFVDVDLVGYNLCLHDNPIVRERSAARAMTAMLSWDTDPRAARALYTNRVAAELFFSAPHPSVIGYRVEEDGQVAVTEDPGRDPDPRLSEVASQINAGIVQGVKALADLTQTLGLKPHLPTLLAPLVRFAAKPTRAEAEEVGSIYNFDAWGSSRGFRRAMASLQNSGKTALEADAWPAGVAALEQACGSAGSAPAAGEAQGRGLDAAPAQRQRRPG